jgi:uncharacterized protein
LRALDAVAEKLLMRQDQCDPAAQVGEESMAENCFVVEATYAEGAAEKRKPHRDEHLERVRKLAAEGALVVAGAFEDMNASLLIFEVDSEDSVRAIVETDVYMKAGVWTDFRIKKLTRVV